MADNYSYNRVPELRGPQDIAPYIDASFQSIDFDQSLEFATTAQDALDPSHSTARQDTADHASFDSSTIGTSSSSSINKIKSGWEKGISQIRRKPLPRYIRGSVQNHPAAEIEPARVSRGVWKDQFLVDRSLRGMALLTTLFALAMVVVVCIYAKEYGARVNKFSSSIGGKTMDCNDVTRTNTIILFFINVAATMLLGMSNTYQQLVTSLNIGDLAHMLRKYGDSRVGTNSPFNMNHKQTGKRKSWAAWLLLVATSLPIHFLANSLTGPSYIFEPPETVELRELSYEDLQDNVGYGADDYQDHYTVYSTHSFACWSAFRTGRAHIPESRRLLMQDISAALGDAGQGKKYTKMVVSYARENCTGLANNTQDVTALETGPLSRVGNASVVELKEGNCSSSKSMECVLSKSKPAKCRLNVRLNAAFVLMAALLIKAIYMITVNVVARGRIKKSLLTFGDVIVASASHPELRIRGECMVNSNEIYRRRNMHTCNKHCKTEVESKTGDEIGHCQRCKKYNDTNRLHNESQPTIATKLKRTLISNLGTTALAQMSIMMFCSTVLVAGSLALAVPLGVSMKSYDGECKDYVERSHRYNITDSICEMSGSQRLAQSSGGWGGFNSSIQIAELPPDNLTNEIISFCISNGAQFIYSLLYLLLIYNVTLISQEYDWGELEHRRKRLRCTNVKGDCFKQDYLLQLPKKILFPIMTYSVLTHWMLGEALQTQEAVWIDVTPEIGRHIEHSKYIITYAAYPVWVATSLILVMTGSCWWAFGYRREGFIPQMFGSIRTLCSATTQLNDFPSNGIMWGDLGMGKVYRHAGLSAEEVNKIVPYELYAGIGGMEEDEERRRTSEAGTGENHPLLWRGKESVSLEE